MPASQEPVREQDAAVIEDNAMEEQAFMEQSDKDESEEPKKKRYYRPNEVMEKKGCVGCGGMALAILVGAFAVIAVSVLS